MKLARLRGANLMHLFPTAVTPFEQPPPPDDLELEQGSSDESDAELIAENRPLTPERRQRRLVANRAFGALKATHASKRTATQLVADALNDIASSATFFVLHVLWFTVWILWNVGALGLRPFDPYPFGFLTLVVSLEAIFLSIFVLMAQKRESAIAELREELALQVNLRIEEEVTKTLQLVSGLYTRLGHVVAEDPELHDMLQPLDVHTIEQDLVEQIANAVARRVTRVNRESADGAGEEPSR